MRIYIVSVIVAVVLSGCASAVPDSIRTATPDDVQISQVREQPQQFRDAVVRWGGSIIRIRNESDHTVLEIVGRDLDKEGRPLKVDRSPGRFLAKLPGFLDPAVYKANREVTVHGRIQGVVEQAIGEYRYSYPLVQTDDVYLWKLRLPVQRHPYYYDPFLYNPWYPWGAPYHRRSPYYP